MSGRVRSGDVRRGPHGQLAVVVRTERGRRGEARTMVVIGLSPEPGVVVSREARPYAIVAGWPLVGRGAISIRDAGGYYFASKRGQLPELVRSWVRL